MPSPLPLRRGRGRSAAAADTDTADRGPAKRLLGDQLGVGYTALELDKEPDGPALQAALYQLTGQRTVPNIFIAGRHIGGWDDISQLHRAGRLLPLVKDFVVPRSSL